MTEEAETVTAEAFDAFDNEQITAQDVVEALRLAFLGQDDHAERGKIADALLDFLPLTDGGRGAALLLRLIAEGAIAVRLS